MGAVISLALKPGNAYVLMLQRADNGSWSTQPHHVYQAPARRREVADFFRARARGLRPQLAPASAPEGMVAALASSIPGSVVTATGYTETSGQPTRCITCDGDEPIPYLIDVDPTILPTGMTQDGAVAAVAEALNAWALASSLKFRYEGIQSFGVAASTVAIQDRRLRIQLHDNYNVINTAGVAGIDGGSFQAAAATFSGGRVGIQGFQERLYGYVVLESTTNASLLLDPTNFKRVLTHEIGHALGLAHSSENPAEPDPILKAATMYYSAPSNSSGAALQIYNVDRIQFGYPVANTPPCTLDRIIPVTTTDPIYGSLPSGTLGVNCIHLGAIDRQGATLTASLTSSTAANGTFSLAGNVLTYTPYGFFGAVRLTDSQIEAGIHYDQAVVQFSDGVNLSNPATCNVIGFAPDTTPADGLPDGWMQTYFATTAPGAIGSGRNPDDDPDHDGLSNRVECYLNTNPLLPNSLAGQFAYIPATRRLAYIPVRFAPYGVESSNTLANGSWTPRRVGTLYQASGTLAFDFSGPTTPPQEFYRIVTGP